MNTQLSSIVEMIPDQSLKNPSKNEIQHQMKASMMSANTSQLTVDQKNNPIDNVD